ncbi:MULTISPECIES: DMT family transporter [unclassified Pseudomonas]|uniref:DMT family transporter n=1 Tax=unclassified Pseudomonas TaxID=196821 RepID=UPI000871AA7A|nr:MULTISPECIES: DMT family transporter [unclassified Pseudomonas]SCW32263.1 Threonine/homoserine efflux transporter RhtA [Pseudomonas sp. NFACC05-1]SCZ20490.1 Threonine/homoserine efflux transporter RhtA [Pseudomonas sp. NFACC44-2]SDA44297.1 Threonine/homoserine efflux transporter RhtA [Pseudomonas sp. NFACC51]SEI48255.1 Threonine/homoserine efflux transporter RhtA [Pseudomonas sp. NFACC07-1]SFH08833.1 Threonine/homoserine efflux transporter RhtA [Pseudomonas sp. NFACC54]
MPLHIICLVLFAALLHASWNAMLRGGTDRLWSMTIMCVAIALASVIVAALLAPPARASWFCVGLSAVLHVGYNLFLVRSYKSGDLGQTYPIARGVSPILIVLAASLFAGERVAPSGLLGIALVSTGILSLAYTGRRRALPDLRYALGTGFFIAAYSVVDGMGVRLSGAPMAYTAWMCLLWGVMMPLVYIGLRDASSLFAWRPGIAAAFAGGLVSLLAYGVVIYAMAHAPMGAVSALRETSVMFAALIGYAFLGEALTLRKLLACAVIALGTLVIG